MPKAADLYAELGLKKDKYDKGMAQAEAAPSKLGKAFGIAGAAIAGTFLVAAAGALALGKASIAAWDAQEKANQGLLVALKGRKDLQESLLEQASRMQRTTLFEDDAIIQAQKMLAVMGLSVVQIKDLIPVIADFSTATGMDMAGAANLVAKAVGTGSNALGRYGVELDSTMSKTEKANSVMAVFTERYGNQAEAAAKTGASGLQQLNKAWGEIQETIGSKIGPFLAALAALTSGKLLEATSGGASSGIQKTINDYVNADKDGRDKIKAGLESSLAEYNRQWKEYKGKQMQAEASHAAGQADIVRESLEKIADLNKETQAEITDEEIKALEAAKKIAADRIQLAADMANKLEIIRAESIDMTGVGNVGNNLFASTDANKVEMPELTIEPIEIPINVQKFSDDLAIAKESWDQFTGNIKKMSENALAGAISGFAEGIGEAIGSGGGMQEAFGSILGLFGSFLKEMGALMVLYGVAQLALFNSWELGPAGAIALIAAGAALGIIGGIMSGAAKNMNKGGATSGGGISSGGVGGGEYRPWQDSNGGGGMLVATVKGQDLVFVMDRAKRTNNRIGG